MSNNKQRNSEKVTSFSDERISKAAMPANETPVTSAKSGSRSDSSSQQSAKSGSGKRGSGNRKDGKSHPSGASQTKAGARSNPTPPAKMAAAKPAAKQVVIEEKAPERAYTSTISFVEKLLPTTGSLMAEAISAKISSLANARDELGGLIEAAKEEGAALKAKVTNAEETIKTISGMVLIGALRTNERLDRLNDSGLEEIAIVEYGELWAQASADVLAQMKIIATAKSRYAENKEMVLTAAKQIHFIDAEIAEWRSML